MTLEEILYWLSFEVPQVAHDYKALLPDINQAITPEIFFKIQPATAGSLADTSLFFWLNATYLGRAIQKHLFNSEPAFADAMTPENLYTTYLQTAHILFGTNPFYWLMTYSAGRDIFYHSSDKNPLLIKQAPIEALTQLRSRQANRFHNTCALTWLTQPDTHDTFDEIKPELVVATEPAYLNGIATHPRCKQVYQMAKQCHEETEANISRKTILSLFQTNHPHFLNFFTACVLNATRPSYIGRYGNASILAFLAADVEQKLPILAQCIEQKLVHPGQFTDAALYARRQAAADIENDTSTLYWLCQSSESIQLLTAFYQAFTLTQRIQLIAELKKAFAHNLLNDDNDENLLSRASRKNLYDYLKTHPSLEAKILMTQITQDRKALQQNATLDSLSLALQPPPSTLETAVASYQSPADSVVDERTCKRVKR